MAKPVGQWHLDKTINISVLIVLVVQFAGLIIYITKMDDRISHLEADQLKDNEARSQLSRMDERLIGMDKILVNLQKLIERMAYKQN